MPGPDPTVHRRRLRIELRNAREAAGHTQREVAQYMDWSPSKLIRIESGQVPISTSDLRSLLAYYQITDSERVEALLELARRAREKSPWTAYRDVASAEFIAFLGYESSASVIRNFEPATIPGLLQTEEYAREVISVYGDLGRNEIATLVELRMRRQEILIQPNAPQLHFILDEAALRRMVGGRPVMRRQVSRLQAMNEQDHVTLRIVPYDVGVYPGWRAAFVTFEFPDPADEDVLYIENAQGEMLIRENTPGSEEANEGDRAPALYNTRFYDLEQIAPHEDTPRMLDDVLNHRPFQVQPQVQPDNEDR
jgi:transcriptional regulator with XRE-family HTH domain